MIYPLTAFRAAMRAAEQVLETLLEQGTQRDLLDRMQTRAELYDLLGLFRLGSGAIRRISRPLPKDAVGRP